MEMTPYICGCCGGRIDVSTMRCMYCDTQYHCIDPMSNTEIIRGEVRVVDPMFDSYRKMGDVATANEIRQFYDLKALQDEVSAEKIRNEVIRAMRGVEHIRR